MTESDNKHRVISASRKMVFAWVSAYMSPEEDVNAFFENDAIFRVATHVLTTIVPSYDFESEKKSSNYAKLVDEAKKATHLKCIRISHIYVIENLLHCAFTQICVPFSFYLR